MIQLELQWKCMEPWTDSETLKPPLLFQDNSPKTKPTDLLRLWTQTSSAALKFYIDLYVLGLEPTDNKKCSYQA